jgi:MFS family permease
MTTSYQQTLVATPDIETATNNRAYTGYVLAILGLISFFNYADRMVLSILLQPIKTDLGLSDTQLGLLSGLAFALFYGSLGIPLARLADRKSRVVLLTGAITVWSLMTALCGLVQNFVQLLLARIGVGVGEAGCVPASHSMVGDYFPKERRAFAIGILQASGSLGVILGLMAAGAIADQWGWRWAFVLVGLPGIAVGLVTYLTVREPTRGGLETTVTASTTPINWRQAVTTLFSRSTYVHLVIALSLGTFTLYGIMQWVPTFLVRSHGLSLTEVGTLVGMAGIGGLIGVIAGSLLAPTLIARDARWELWLPALAFAASVPFYVMVFILASPVSAIWALFAAGFVAAFGTGPGLASIQAVSEPNLRATAVAIVMFSSALFGQGAGPFLVGLLSDGLMPTYGEGLALRIALICSTLLIFWAALHFVLAARTLRRERVN